MCSATKALTQHPEKRQITGNLLKMRGFVKNATIGFKIQRSFKQTDSALLYNTIHFFSKVVVILANPVK